MIAEVLKVEDESTLDKVASILKGKKPRKKPIKKELEIFLGIISKEETEMMTKTIKETAGTVLRTIGNSMVIDTNIVVDLFKGKGKPIPTNDIRIAAIAIQNGLTLATQDKHFSEIQELAIENR